ncbi:RNA recognition motif domain-containing protein [Flavisolibacter nicotianae]|uniref:RNA recognition motif domain-containing protein n=1 Tax=Flavisolibacter nicotianae TaxID=2364882 RepID=UPI000EB5C89F|nr:RNA-binding protein [Flavisolibacter nicotianae]
MQIHITNLHGNMIEADIQRLFTKYGEVELVKLVRDKLNNRSLGHAYVDMPVQKEALLAISSLHETDVKGKRIRVAEVIYDPAPHASWNVSKNA